MERTCPHLDFNASVAVSRVGERGDGSDNFIAEVVVICRDCGDPFQFVAPRGASWDGPKASADGQTLYAPMRPSGDFIEQYREPIGFRAGRRDS
jgi:hypothetical protein